MTLYLEKQVLISVNEDNHVNKWDLKIVEHLWVFKEQGIPVKYEISRKFLISGDTKKAVRYTMDSQMFLLNRFSRHRFGFQDVPHPIANLPIAEILAVIHLHPTDYAVDQGSRDQHQEE